MKQRFQVLAAALLTATAFTASAANNPTAATAGTSEGALDITLNLTPLIIVNGFDDIILDATTNSDISGTDTLCVGGFGFQTFSVDFGSLNGNADLTGGANSTDPFLLQDSNTSETIPYSVDFTKGAQSDSSSDGSMATAFTRDAGDTIGLCQGGNSNAALTVSVAAADWAGVDGNTFTDTLTVQVTAN